MTAIRALRLYIHAMQGASILVANPSRDAVGTDGQ